MCGDAKPDDGRYLYKQDSDRAAAIQEPCRKKSRRFDSVNDICGKRVVAPNGEYEVIGEGDAEYDEEPAERCRKYGGGGDDLISGLPNSIVLDCIIPRIPWHSRAVLIAATRSWRAALRRPLQYSRLTRLAAPPPYGSLVIVHQVSDTERSAISRKIAAHLRKKAAPPLELPPPQALSIWDGDTWRRLPPIYASSPLPIPQDCGVACADGSIFVIGGLDAAAAAASSAVFSLDIGSGDWRWRARRPMPAPRVEIHCRMAGGGGGRAARIVVVGAAAEGAGPLVYDVERDEWGELPPVAPAARMVSYGGLAATRGGGIMVFGWEANGRREMVGFWREYDEKAGEWRRWEEGEGCSRLVAGEMDLREGGVVVVLDPAAEEAGPARRRWRVVEGRLRSRTWWREEVSGGGGRKRVVAAESCCAHSFVVAGMGSVAPKAYATVCEGESRKLTLWRADFDADLSRAQWSGMPVPGNLAMCSQIASLHG